MAGPLGRLPPSGSAGSSSAALGRPRPSSVPNLFLPSLDRRRRQAEETRSTCPPAARACRPAGGAPFQGVSKWEHVFFGCIVRPGLTGALTCDGDAAVDGLGAPGRASAACSGSAELERQKGRFRRGATQAMASVQPRHRRAPRYPAGLGDGLAGNCSIEASGADRLTCTPTLAGAGGRPQADASEGLETGGHLAQRPSSLFIMVMLPPSGVPLGWLAPLLTLFRTVMVRPACRAGNSGGGGKGEASSVRCPRFTRSWCGSLTAWGAGNRLRAVHGFRVREETYRVCRAPAARRRSRATRPESARRIHVLAGGHRTQLLTRLLLASVRAAT